MREFKRIAGLAVALLLAVTAAIPSGAQAAPKQEGPVVVGRVSHIEGQLLRYVYEEKDWVPILKDVPFGLEDSLYSDQDAKAEILFPNGTWVRIGGSTQIQAISLDDEVTEIDVASGIARFYNRGSQSVIKATTPFGYVLAPAESMFDLYVGDESVEVIALKGSVEFVHGKNQSRFEVQSGSSSLIADNQTVANGNGMVDADFDEWNSQRDSIWAKRLDVKGDSTRYLPPQLADDAYEFEENGRWERVEYQGEYRNLWRPTTVASDWAPYTSGRWTSYYGDQCWVPYEPFGYTTHHYGSWVFIDSCRCWYWAPPVVQVLTVARPWTVGYGWYPGRVSWIYGADNVGWVPLAPYEPYYATRYWGPASVAVAAMNLATAVVNLTTLHNLDHAVFVGHRDFWGVDNYRGHVVRNINRTTIINNYHASPIVDRRVIRDFDSRRDRFNFVNKDVTFKPHRTVVERIDQNRRLAERQQRLEARTLLRETRNIRQGTLDQSARIERPRATNRLVSPDSVNKPASEVKFQQRVLKQQERQQKAVDQRILRQQQRDEALQKREDQQQQRQQLRDQQQQQKQQQLDERRKQLEERRQQRPDRPDAVQRQQMLEERRQQRQQQLDQRRQPGEEGQQVRPERPDATQRQKMLEERRQQRQQQLEQRRQPGEEGQQVRPERPDATQRQKMLEERQQQRQQQLEQRRQPGEERQQVRPERPDATQRQQMLEERQQQRQQQLEQRRQQREERQQVRPERPDATQRQQMLEQQQQQRQLQRQQQLQERQQQHLEQQQQQRQPQMQERQQQRQQQLQERQQQQPKGKRPQPGEEDQQQTGGRTP